MLRAKLEKLYRQNPKIVRKIGIVIAVAVAAMTAGMLLYAAVRLAAG